MKKVSESQQLLLDSKKDNPFVPLLPKFRTQFGNTPKIKESWNNGISMTVPDQSMSIAEIMQRHVQGRPIPKSNNVHYTGNTVYPNISRKVDAADMAAANARFMIEQEREVRKKRADRKEALRAEKAAKSNATTNSSESEAKAQISKATNEAADKAL